MSTVNTDPRRGPASRRGFTLVEVLIAFVILAVGLLALEAMGIRAARLVTRSQRLADYSTMATSKLEAAMDTIRGGTIPTTTSGSFTGGTWARQVTTTILTSGTIRNVRISVRPTADAVLATRDSFYVSGNVLN
jgi:prepilin-type N-terminal cleavage/methylation domain-containing protein